MFRTGAFTIIGLSLAASGLASLPLAAVQGTGTLGPGVPNFWVRPGFRVDLVANLPNVRFLQFGGDDGTLYASRPNNGDIVTLKRGPSGTFTASTFLGGLSTVHGMDYSSGWLWFSQSGAIKRARDTDGDGDADEVVTVLSNLPSGGGHGLRSILVTGSAFYTSIGDSGNASDETGTERQKIWRFNLDGTGKTLFASGLRNTEKLRMRPGTSQIYGADHGSDNWGANYGESGGNQPFTDVNPPDEFNLYESGKFYGHPFVVGDRVPRSEYGGRSDIVAIGAATRIPAWKFGAHWAPNGFSFVGSGDNVKIFGNDAYVALHGSWNSTVPVGYRIERVMFDPVLGTPFGGQPMVITVRDGAVLGRPVDVAEDPTGGFLFSDDGTGRIYRVQGLSLRR